MTTAIEKSPRTVTREHLEALRTQAEQDERQAKSDGRQGDEHRHSQDRQAIEYVLALVSK
jgi:hypothetical protein